MMELRATVQSLYIGDDPTSLVKTSKPLIDIGLSGVRGDKHAGYTRRSGGREKEYPRGVEITLSLRFICERCSSN